MFDHLWVYDFEAANRCVPTLVQEPYSEVRPLALEDPQKMKVLPGK